MSTQNISIVPYQEKFLNQWDDFIQEHAYNGTFLSSRKFINYHFEGKFKDHSLIFMQNQTTIVAILPACEIEMDGVKTLYSHRGATFGGIIFCKKHFKIDTINSVISCLDAYLKESHFKKIVLRQSPTIFSAGCVDSLDYLFSVNGFYKYEELSSVIDLSCIPSGHLVESFRPNTRSKTRQAMGKGLVCKYVGNENDINKFHDILAENLKKHDATPVHSRDELFDIKRRFPKEIQFIHCYHDNVEVASTMVWKFKDKVFHTQNIAIDYKYSDLRPANFLIYYLIQQALDNSFQYFSFGISTEHQGKHLNFDLCEFKEGFGAKGYLNRTFFKSFN